MNKNRVIMSAIRYDPHSQAYELVSRVYWPLVCKSNMPFPISFLNDLRKDIIEAMEKYDYGQ